MCVRVEAQANGTGRRGADLQRSAWCGGTQIQSCGSAESLGDGAQVIARQYPSWTNRRRCDELPVGKNGEIS